MIYRVLPRRISVLPLATFIEKNTDIVCQSKLTEAYLIKNMYILEI